VLLSTGEKIVGKVYMTRGKRLRVRDPKRKRPREVALTDLERLEVLVLKKRIERDWRFKEEGSPEKVFTGKTYPRLDFGLKLTFASGDVLEGLLVKGTTVYVEPPEGKRRRFILTRFVSDKETYMGKTPEQIVYLKEVSFAPPEKAGGKTAKSKTPIPTKRDAKTEE